MKTLNEVIKANECCDHGEPDSRCEGCPYNGIGACCAERETDALHYLKELKDILDPLKVKKISHEITCPQCNSVIAILLPESNNPLTWDELKQMEGKPVWVETFNRKDGRWVIFLRTRKLRIDPCEIAIFSNMSRGGSTFYRDNYGKTWQAYRKERGC